MTEVLGVDPGLLARFRAAHATIRWRDAPRARRRPAPPGGVRIAHLHDEEARVVTLDAGADGTTLQTDSGPVGALVLLIEVERRGTPVDLRAREAAELPGFPQGALEARWGGPRPAAPGGIGYADLVALARYALA
ncbi:MAG TPA: hypothetical protein VMH78_04340 [Thermoplasmata archaeon]|nr:hypothetical protein [Thermoplasmata archaeon]